MIFAQRSWNCIPADWGEDKFQSVF